MRKNDIINRLIVFLAITAIYQTSTLWLNQTSGKTFASFISDSATFFNQQKEETNVLLATRYAIGIGDGFYSLYYPDNVGESFFLEETNDILNEILSDRTVVFHKGTANWKELLKSTTVILQYDFLVKGIDYLANYSNLKDNQIPNEFDYLIIVPADSLGGDSKAYFINSETDETVSYSTNKSQTASNFYTNLNRTSEELTYISTSEKMNSSILDRNIFLPQWANLPHHYYPIKEVTVFGESGAVDQIFLESVVENFFSNFSVNWNNSNEVDSFLFSDNETVVRYNQNSQMIEYFNYSAYGNSSKQTSLLDGYELSCQFLKNDISLKTDIYLSNISRNNEETIYFFDYVVDDMPVILSADIKEKIGSDYAMSVTVKSDVVKNYKRYMVNYEKETDIDKVLTVPFIDALDLSVNMYTTQINNEIVSRVSDIYLGYYISNMENNELKWFINLYDNIFLADTDGRNIENITEKHIEDDDLGDTEAVDELNEVDEAKEIDT